MGTGYAGPGAIAEAATYVGDFKEASPRIKVCDYGLGFQHVPWGELKDLRAAKAKLDALEAAGVDNWEGYGEAMQALHEEAEG